MMYLPFRWFHWQWIVLNCYRFILCLYINLEIYFSFFQISMCLIGVFICSRCSCGFCFYLFYYIISIRNFQENSLLNAFQFCSSFFLFSFFFLFFAFFDISIYFLWMFFYSLDCLRFWCVYLFFLGFVFFNESRTEQ